ncbi:MULTISPECIES: nucleoside deaminase [Providencia]|uniref:Cytidine and deoxycytidylate deaminase zinc-binding region n=3 Tax=Providencia stuartii TaxID=588 RepID=A0AA86YN63_PROST|nr:MULTISPECIES: nucleoside deaminase [Providencia]EDU60937.1 cytidine and deoxycytidylate deaminase zinc-binding region [Providencia stuartii ATCC 25827]MDQ5992465.1 nucleoside deaminase [Providencia stuartii]HEM6871472.1 nucleoside deaminase [Providencia stuartii]HEM7175003.1 nucleoside deaminase [Providencia stuartii]
MEKQRELDIQFMAQALELAAEATKKGNEPFGAVLVKDNQVVMTGENHIHTESDPTYHAELGLIRQYCSEHKIMNLSEYTLYTSCEPCCMCSGAMVWSQLGRMVYSLSHDELAEIAGFNIMLGSDEIFAKSPFKPEVTHGVLKEKAMLIYTQYFQATT